MKNTDNKIFWLEQQRRNVPKDNVWLSENEQKMLTKIRILKRRADWRLGRCTAKQLLSVFFSENDRSLSLTDIEIYAAADGAPEAFISGKPTAITISISHSQGTAFCVVVDSLPAVGCDLEQIVPRSQAFITDYFTSSEIAVIELAKEKARPLLSTLIWSAKESTLKALREGLRLDTRSVETHFTSTQTTDEWRPFKATFSKTNKTFYGWWRYDEHFVQTVVTESTQSSLCRLAVS